MERTRGPFRQPNRKAVERRSGAHTEGGPHPPAEPTELRGDPRQALGGEDAYVNRVEEFLSEKGKRWSASTIELYRRYLRDLGRWLSQQPAVATDDITTRLLVRWLDARPQWSGSTQYTAIIAVRSFFRWRLGREASPAETLPLPRRPIRPQRTLDEIKARRLLSTIDTSRPKGIRDLAIITVLLDTGLRASEVCHLRKDELDLECRTLTCRRKGGEWASSVFSVYTQSCIERWLGIRDAIARDKVLTLFVGIGGNTPGRPLTRDGLRTVMQQLGVKAGIGKLSPHDFRRTFATLALRAGGPMRIVQVQGNWEDAKMLERYTQAIVPRDFDPYSPVGYLMGLRGKDEDR